MSKNKIIRLEFEVNQDFFNELHKIMKGNDHANSKEIDPIEHLRNSLELYAQVIEGISEGKTPALIDSDNLSADKLYLPPLLALFKHEKEIDLDRKIDFKKALL